MKREKETKKQKSRMNKAKKIRNIVMMSLLCVMMIAGATYAWFTLSKTAKVTNLTMTVGEATGLQIAANKAEASGVNTDEPGTYGSVLEFKKETAGVTYQILGKLLPATTQDGKTFSKPDYNEDGEVSNLISTTDKLTNLTESTETEGYYYETTFYMKSLGKDATIQLKQGEKTDGTFSTGTYVTTEKKSGNTSDYLGTYALRISLTVGTGNDAKTLIYEPNSDVTSLTGGTKASVVSTLSEDVKAKYGDGVTATSKQNADGTWNGDQSQTLTLDADEDTLVTMRIWIEGTDEDCVNEISLDEIIAQLMFEEVTNSN